MQTLTGTWVSGNVTHTVTTPRLEGEEAAAWAARHKEAVDMMLGLFPVDPPAGG